MNKTQVYLVTASTIVGGLGLLSVMPALLSVMMFDAPGSQENPATNLLFWSVFLFPLTCVVSVACAWGLYAAKVRRWAILVTGLPMINVLLGVIAIVWLELAYGGKFNG